jgi:hypothetical protein
MKQRLLVRNVEARGLLDILFLSGITSILLLRFYLHLTHYPTVGGGKYHIAHLLYGGLLLLVAVVLNLAFFGRRLQRLTALLGGAGFGIFIDEVGKFVTRDTNYFFQPSIGIIYAIFVVLYLAFSFLGRREQLTNLEYQLNALMQLEEAVRYDMDRHEKAAVAKLLAKADQDDMITKQLQQFLHSVEVVRAPSPTRLHRLAGSIDRVYQHAWRLRTTNALVRIFFSLTVIVSVIALAFTLQHNVQNVQSFLQGDKDYGHGLVVGQLAATAFATSLALIGLVRLRKSRASAFEWFRRATLVNLLLTEFFIFSRIQFGAMPSFLFNLALFLLIKFVLSQERRAISKAV